ncbi:MAG TPA: D-cysteine desulfhydrase family protein [Allosphingosinicella sp.]
MTGLAKLGGFPKFGLIDAPTPIQRLERLERAIGLGRGTRLWVKRDDLGLGGGGNKLRKLEYLLGEALAGGCDTFVTTGGIQSNHARLSAAASARAGLACELVLAHMVPRDDPEYRHGGNVLLDGLFGAAVHIVDGPDAWPAAERLAATLRAEGRRPYLVGAGGSSPVGCLGYAGCAAEIAAQEAEMDLGFARIAVPNGSSGTHAGLAAGFAAMGMDPARVKSFTVLAPLDEARRATLDLARRTLELLDEAARIEAEGIAVAGEQRGEGYGIPTSAMLEAVRLMARTEGLLLDPVYSGKAFAGFLADSRSGEEGDLLYVMTGGTPGLFAYRSEFERSGSGEE